MIKRACARCGKETELLSWETNCFRCQQKTYEEGITAQIISGEAEETCCEDEVYCPYCGEKQSMDDWYKHYEEGEHDYECHDCDKKFVIDTSLKYTFSTRRAEEQE